MVTQTCSKVTPPVNSLSAEPTSTPSHFSVNFVLFDRSNPCKPLCINIPLLLFVGKAQDCRDLFSTVLLDEFEINIKKTNINFWKPNEHLLLDTATRRGWTERINDIEEFCTPIPLPRPFATALPEIDNLDIVHLVVTANSLNAPCRGNMDGSPSDNRSAQSTAANADLHDLQRRILEFIASGSGIDEGVHVNDITRAVASPDVNDASQISAALEGLLESGHAYNTIDDLHFQACE